MKQNKQAVGVWHQSHHRCCSNEVTDNNRLP